MCVCVCCNCSVSVSLHSACKNSTTNEHKKCVNFIAMRYEVSHEWWVIHNLVFLRYLMSALLGKDI